MRKDLPVGQHNFDDLVHDNGVYVDKTAYIHQLMTGAKRFFFLSRPRRFGKSLLLSTIQAVFEGRKDLFKGLYIEDKIDWEAYPVIMLDMSKNSESVKALEDALAATLKTYAAFHHLALDDSNDPCLLLEQLIGQIFLQTGKHIVVLIDEYEKPILDNLDNPALAQEIRKFLHTFYGILKASSNSIRFLLVTGISKISQTSIFSGLNNLLDLTFDENYTEICGYTQKELEFYFAEYIQVLAEKKKKSRSVILEEIKHWYNGYSWDGKVFVYNPYSVLLLFNYGYFQPHWFSTGTSTGFLTLLKSSADITAAITGTSLVNRSFSDKQTLENLDTVTLLFQAGYLTVKSYDEERDKFLLKVPNEEVRNALSESILVELSGKTSNYVDNRIESLKEALSRGETAVAMENLDILFSTISYNTQKPTESYYHALFQLAMNVAGIDQHAESYNHIGRADSILKFKDRVYVVEIKFAKTKKELPDALNKAMVQIKDNQYAKPYQKKGLKIHLLAIAFTKGVLEFQEEVF
ncbi:PD-(D/E)XK nuclease superfamily protein [bacterium A37T11]|nr:PD-(D/E)XK nuclease superfamily protein [bacterium A37T11]